MTKTGSVAQVEMQSSWLVQRLTKPRGGSLLGPDNPFAFGGGLRNGGLSGEAMNVLRPIFSFDYMGAAEFEFGAVPEALSQIRDAAVAGALVAESVSIPLSKVPANWRIKKAEAQTVEGEAVLYLLCRDAHLVEVRRRVSVWARQESPRLKEGLRLTSTLRPYDKYDGKAVGWLELDNGFFFFADRDMWAQTAGLFGVEVSA